jgi:DNA end-binding protein Ku
MAPRASWRGFLKIGEVSCAVALYAAASTSDRVAFHMINRKTGHRLRRDYVDAETGKPVDSDDQVKGYETDGGDHILFEPEELRAVVPQSDKRLDVDAFIACSDVDLVYFDRPYFLAPGDKAAVEAFNLMREGLKARKVAALARAVLFRRSRTLLIRPHGAGLLANTLNFDHEVREAAEVFSDIDDMKIEGEMLDLARHIIETKSGRFDPASFSDRYDDALAELVRAKAAGKALPKAPEAEPSKVVDLMAALRESAKAAKKPSRKPAAKAPAQKKAG